MLSRFLSIDPWSGNLEDPQSLNKYSYTRNNPVKYVDPSGKYYEGYNNLSREQVIFYEKASLGQIMGPLPQSQANTLQSYESQKALHQSLVRFSGIIGGDQTFANYQNTLTQKDLNGFSDQDYYNLANGLEQTSNQIFMGAIMGGGAALGGLGSPQIGDRVYRLYGGQSSAAGRYWSPTDPRELINPRDALGLPNGNTAERLNIGKIKNLKGLEVRPAQPLDGNKGGATEYKFGKPSDVKSVKQVKLK